MQDTELIKTLMMRDRENTEALERLTADLRRILESPAMNSIKPVLEIVFPALNTDLDTARLKQEGCAFLVVGRAIMDSRMTGQEKILHWAVAHKKHGDAG